MPARLARLASLALIVVLGWICVAVWSRYWLIRSVAVDRAEADQWP